MVQTFGGQNIRWPVSDKIYDRDKAVNLKPVYFELLSKFFYQISGGQM